MTENGQGRDGKPPFGPHGEDCDCDWDAEETPEEAAPEEVTATVGPKLVLTEFDPSNRHELIFGAVSDMLVQQFLITNETLMMEGNALTRAQLTKIIGMLMRGYAAAKEAAWMVEEHYAQLMIEAREELAEEEEKEPNPLGEIKKAFTDGSV